MSEPQGVSVGWSCESIQETGKSIGNDVAATSKHLIEGLINAHAGRFCWDELRKQLKEIAVKQLIEMLGRP